MGLRHAKPWTFRPKGLADAIDGSNTFGGAMSVLQNLVPNPANADQWVARPAAEKINDFSGITTPLGGTALLLLGTKAWGMIPSGLFPGKDQPFCIDLLTGNLIPIGGMTQANLPDTQPTTGDWTPPTMVASTNGRITITHPGYDGATTFIGWIDLSSFVSDTITGTPDGTTTISDLSANVLQVGWAPGLAVTGLDVPANTSIVSIASDGLSAVLSNPVPAPATITGNTHHNLLVDELSTDVLTLGWGSGDAVQGADIPVGAKINTIAADGLSFTLTIPATAATVGESLTLAGIALTVSGGTPSAPLYSAGNTNGQPLTIVPSCAGVFTGRTYYGMGNFAVYSDTLQPQQITNASQALVLGDNTPITALVGLPLANQVTGGAVQALIVFKGAQSLFQITGDEATSNLALNAIDGSVGTLAPNTICSTTKGLAYVAPDGLRILGFNAVCGDPIGQAGQGVNVPITDVVSPSRMAAAFSDNVIRISCQPTRGGQTSVEYFYDLGRGIWSGPHTFPYSIIRSYYEGSAASCIGFAVGIDGALWQARARPVGTSSYIENGVLLQCTYKTVLLPDNDAIAGNAMVETNLACRTPRNGQILIVAAVEDGTPLDIQFIPAGVDTATIWGEFNWGEAPWGGTSDTFGQKNIPWSKPLVFKQMTITALAPASDTLVLGNLYLRYQILGYNYPDNVLQLGLSQAFILTEDGNYLCTEDGDLLVQES